MEGNLAKHLRLYLRLIEVQLRGQLQYRTAFVMDVLATAFLTMVGFGSLAMIFQRFENLGGWSLSEIAFLYGMVEFSFGTMDMLFSGFDPQYFGQQVRRGTFDQLLLRPLPITLQVLGSKFVLRRVGRIAQGALILLLGILASDLGWTVGKVLYLPVVLVSLVSFFGGLFVLGSTITFWTIESVEVMNIFTYGGSEMMAYPMHIYDEWIRRFFTFVIPAIFLNYYPALYFLDKPDPFGLPPIAPFLAPLAGFGILALSLKVWTFGITHYQSTGS